MRILADIHSPEHRRFKRGHASIGALPGSFATSRNGHYGRLGAREFKTTGCAPFIHWIAKHGDQRGIVPGRERKMASRPCNVQKS